MDKEILRSVFGLSLEYSDKKLPHYHKGMEMRFVMFWCLRFEMECFRSMKLRIFCEKVLQKNHKVKRVNSYLQFFLGQNLKISLEWYQIRNTEWEYAIHIHFKIEAIKSLLILRTPNYGKSRHKRYMFLCPFPTRTPEVSKILP